MSTRSANRQNRPQKHKNATAWNPNKFKQASDSKTKVLNNIVVSGCCSRCTDIIQWKLDYGKYKPLSQPAKCSKCLEKRIKSAYLTLCTACANEAGACAKCAKPKGEIIVPAEQLSAADEARLLQHQERQLKLLPERKRRAFLRQLAKEQEAFEAGEDPRSQAEIRKESAEKLAQLIEAHGRNKDEDFLDDFDDLELSEEEEED